MADFNQGYLQIKMILDDKNVTLKWLGKSGHEKPSTVLNPYFKSIINSLIGKTVYIDYRDLKYMNSSTVPAIIQFLEDLNALSIPTTIIYKKDSKWQSVFFNTIEILAKVLQTVEVEGK